MLERRGESSGDVGDDEMARMFSAHLTKIEGVLANRENCAVLYVEHRDAVDNPSAVALAVNDFLGGHLDTEAMTAVVDPQLYVGDESSMIECLRIVRTVPSLRGHRDAVDDPSAVALAVNDFLGGHLTPNDDGRGGSSALSKSSMRPTPTMTRVPTSIRF